MQILLINNYGVRAENKWNEIFCTTTSYFSVSYLFCFWTHQLKRMVCCYFIFIYSSMKRNLSKTSPAFGGSGKQTLAELCRAVNSYQTITKRNCLHQHLRRPYLYNKEKTCFFVRPSVRPSTFYFFCYFSKNSNFIQKIIIE